MRDIYQHILELDQKGKAGILVTTIEVKGSVPRHSGSKMVVHADGSIFGTIGGGKLEAMVIEDALKMFDGNLCKKKSYKLTEDQGILCGGNVEFLFEPIGQSDRLIIFGAGHISHALAPLAKQAGFHVTVVDNRPEYASRERFSNVDQLVAKEYGEALADLQFTPRTFIVIVTHGHAHDEEILQFCVQKPFAYVGMIGSKRKTRTILDHLTQKGISSQQLQRVHSPIGLRIGAETPLEIAISILAEIIAVRNGADIESVSMKLTESK
jgi:xanthine dehydrogenase accessory factor